MSSPYELEITEDTTIEEISPVPDNICEIPNTFVTLDAIDEMSADEIIGKFQKKNTIKK